MIVPRYWAEGRLRHHEPGRQITARRFGWSDVSPQDAQAHADQRTREALDRLVSGEKLPRREPKVPYNGADGVPIREEIVSRHGDAVITRNSYGARCLNVADVLFADVDLPVGPPPAYFFAAFAVALPCILLLPWKDSPWFLGVFGRIFTAVFVGLVLAVPVHRFGLLIRGGAERIARRRFRRFVARHPQWNLRVYRTPGGYRVLATHQTFVPDDPQVDPCFRALSTDQIYARMCRKQ